MSGGYISIYNQSSVISDGELQTAIVDFQSQLDYEFNWYWGMWAYLDLYGGGTPIIIVDYPGPNDPQDALGYHFIDGNYNPYAVIFAGLCRDYGYPITGVISHEMLEMVADQLIETCNIYDLQDGQGTGILVIQEVCDACESNLYYEAPNGTIVSDFVTPAWFVPGDPNQVDFLGAIPGPLTLASGGYISYEYVTQYGWQQASADKAQQDIAKATAALRQKITTGGNPRTDVVRQLQAKGLAQRAQQQAGGQQAGRQPPQRGAAPPAMGRQQATQQGGGRSFSGLGDGQRGPLEPRVQALKQNSGQVKVVKRQEVPELPSLGAQQQASQQPAGRGGSTSGGPRVQGHTNGGSD